MFMNRLLPVLAVFALLLGTRGLLAQTADDATVCHKSSGAEALAACDRAIASGGFTGPELARLHTSRGVERRRAKDIDGAIADYDAAIKINAKDQFAFNNRANLWRDKGDLARAIADYSEAIRIDPGYTAAYVNRGLVYESLKDLDRARADYQQVLAMPPRYANGPGGQDMARKRLAALSKAP
jgi:tetratricopeptide (TPR) repeat protein